LKASPKANPCPSRIAAVKEDLKASRCPAGRPGKYHGLQPLYTEIQYRSLRVVVHAVNKIDQQQISGQFEDAR